WRTSSVRHLESSLQTDSGIPARVTLSGIWYKWTSRGKRRTVAPPPILGGRAAGSSCSGQVAIQHCGRDTEAISNLADGDIWIGERRPSNIQVILNQLLRSTSRSTRSARYRAAIPKDAFTLSDVREPHRRILLT